jgi:hypothetical protein
MRADNKRSGLKWGLLLLLLLIFISSCGSIGIKEINLSQTISNKIPLKVGLYLSSSLCNYHYRGAFEGQWTGDFLLGDSVCTSAPIFFKKFFTEVIITDGKTDLSNNLKLIISPEIIEAETRGPTQETRITIKWTFVSPEGKVYYLNTVTGNARSDIGIFLPKRGRVAFTNALTDHFQKLQVDIHNSKWWENIE